MARKIRDLGYNPGVGVLYRHNGVDFIVYTGESKQGWDVAHPRPEDPTMPGPVIHRADSEKEAVAWIGQQ